MAHNKKYFMIPRNVFPTAERTLSLWCTVHGGKGMWILYDTCSLDLVQDLRTGVCVYVYMIGLSVNTQKACVNLLIHRKRSTSALF